MAIHPWTNYEIARMRDAERLKLAHAAMRSLEAREARTRAAEQAGVGRAASWLDRIRRRRTVTPPRTS